jgi:predicted nucleic acid-binding protein
MMGVPVLEPVGLLLLAVERRHLAASDADQILNGARERGFRIADRLVESFKSRLHELSGE